MQVKENHSQLLRTGLWQAGFLLLTPLTAVWLMQFAYGVLPWSLGLGPTLANALCVALLFWPLCALVGRIASCCIGTILPPGCGARRIILSTLSGARPFCPGTSPP